MKGVNLLSAYSSMASNISRTVCGIRHDALPRVIKIRSTEFQILSYVRVEFSSSIQDVNVENITIAWTLPHILKTMFHPWCVINFNEFLIATSKNILHQSYTAFYYSVLDVKYKTM